MSDRPVEDIQMSVEKGRMENPAEEWDAVKTELACMGVPERKGRWGGRDTEVPSTNPGR